MGAYSKGCYRRDWRLASIVAIAKTLSRRLRLPPSEAIPIANWFKTGREPVVRLFHFRRHWDRAPILDTLQRQDAERLVEAYSKFKVAEEERSVLADYVPLPIQPPYKTWVTLSGQWLAWRDARKAEVAHSFCCHFTPDGERTLCGRRVPPPDRRRLSERSEIRCTECLRRLQMCHGNRGWNIRGRPRAVKDTTWRGATITAIAKTLTEVHGWDFDLAIATAYWFKKGKMIYYNWTRYLFYWPKFDTVEMSEQDVNELLARYNAFKRGPPYEEDSSKKQEDAPTSQSQATGT